MRVAQLRVCLFELTLLGGFLLPATSNAGAQSSGSIGGVVSDSSGAIVYGAEISLVGTTITTRSDDAGEFRLGNIPEGLATIRVRRLGFVSISIPVQVTAREGPMHLEVRLARAATTLKPLLVQAKRVDYTGRLSGYYQRLEHQSGGTFITREQIDRENPQMLTQMLSRVAGINSTRMRAGGSGVRMRGRNCWPLVWLDGFPMGAGEVDLDAFPPSSIQGIELYLGATGAPARYTALRDMSSCGTILIWSRGPDTDPITSASRAPLDLEKLVASLSVFTADQVDTAVQLDPLHQIAVNYPPPLFAARIGGTVVAEFIVDATGRVEDGSLGIVASSNPLFSDAVRQALQGATFTPAFRHGSAVRQVVQQPFEFNLTKPHPPGG
jgi:TonB family protein